MKRKLKGNHCQCARCGKYFNSLSAFDKHRTGPFTHNVLSRECMFTEQMIAKGMAENAKGFWMTPNRSGSSLAHWRKSGDL